MVDFVLTNERARELVEKVEVGERVESDYQPIEVIIEGQIQRKGSESCERIRSVVNWEENCIRR